MQIFPKNYFKIFLNVPYTKNQFFIVTEKPLERCSESVGDPFCEPWKVHV